jgi:uncharacterized protein YndB with AHSA1/START domain
MVFSRQVVRTSQTMSFTAETSITIDAPPSHVFDQLANVAAWHTWMPPSFDLARGPGEELPQRVGERFRVHIASMPYAVVLRLSRLDRPREIAWTGGIRGLLWAEHRFTLTPEGERRTRVRSIETWRGALAYPSRRFVKPLAQRIGTEQLAGLARACVPPN